MSRPSPLTYEECYALFDLPVAEAASVLGVSRPTISKVLRAHGVPRWPYRKLKAQRKLEAWRRRREGRGGEVRGEEVGVPDPGEVEKVERERVERIQKRRGRAAEQEDEGEGGKSESLYRGECSERSEGGDALQGEDGLREGVRASFEDSWNGESGDGLFDWGQEIELQCSEVLDGGVTVESGGKKVLFGDGSWSRGGFEMVGDGELEFRFVGSEGLGISESELFAVVERDIQVPGEE